MTSYGYDDIIDRICKRNISQMAGLATQEHPDWDLTMLNSYILGYTAATNDIVKLIEDLSEAHCQMK